MDKIKYVGIDLHQSTCLIAVHDQHGKSQTEAIVETRAETLRDFFDGLSGSIHAEYIEQSELASIFNRFAASEQVTAADNACASALACRLQLKFICGRKSSNPLEW